MVKNLSISHVQQKSCPLCKHFPGPYYNVEIIDEKTAHAYKRCRCCSHEWVQVRPLIPRLQKSTGYMVVTVPVVSKTATFSSEIIGLHRIVWELHYGKLPQGYIVHHLNGDKSDNRIENLIGIPKAKHNCHKDYPLLKVIRA